MKTYLSGLTAFNNRYYKSSTGGQASQYILDTVNKVKPIALREVVKPS